MAIGICDWGCGGLRLLKALRSARADLDTVYIADQASEAYSLLSREALQERVGHILRSFLQIGVERVVFACDSASTVLPELIMARMTVSGVIEPVLRSMAGRSLREVGIIGGRRTILSGAYGRALRKQRFMVVQRISLDLANSIESGDVDSESVHDTVRDLLEPLVKVDGILLANTHYPIIEPLFRKLLPNAQIIDPTFETVRELAGDLPRFSGSEGSSIFLTTGSPSHMSERAHKIFGTRTPFSPFSLDEPKLAA